MKMKVREFIKLNTDIDVYDDVCEELAIAFCGPAMLAKEGEEHFVEVLDYEMELDMTGEIWTAVCHVDDEFFPDLWKHKLRRAKEFFYALAGYCADEDYKKWFCEPEGGQYATDPDANVTMCIYCDTTPWYTEAEMNRDNLCDLEFPRKMVEEYFNTLGDTEHSFVEWLNDICDADSNDGLFAFCKDRGFIAIRQDR